MKRAALYLRVSTAEQSPESQLQDLRVLAEQRQLTIVDEYVDHGISGAHTSRPALDRLLADAHHGKFDVLAIWAFDRLARSVSHLIRLLDELNELGIEFVSYREAIDTHGPLGRAITVILGAIAELERSIIRERVCAGIRRARREGRHLGRHPLPIDHAAIARDRQRGLSLRQVAAMHRISKSTVQRIVAGVPKTFSPPANSPHQNDLPPTRLPVPEPVALGTAWPPVTLSLPAMPIEERPAKTEQLLERNGNGRRRVFLAN